AGARLPAARACTAAARTAAPRPPVVVLGARAVRALLVPLLRGARRRVARGARDGSGWEERAESDRSGGRGSSPPRDGRSRSAGAAGSRGGAGLVPGGHRRGAGADCGVRALVLR